MTEWKQLKQGGYESNSDDEHLDSRMGNIAINVIEDLRKLGEVLVPLVSKLGGISDVP